MQFGPPLLNITETTPILFHPLSPLSATDIGNLILIHPASPQQNTVNKGESS